MGLRIITPVVSPVIPLVELRAHLRLDLLGGATHPDDALIEIYLKAARSYCEHYTQRSVGQQTLELTLDEFPDNAVELPFGASSITSVKYVNDAMSTFTLPSTEYVLDNASHQHWALTTDVWPTVGEYANAIEIRYVTPSTIDDAVKSAMLLYVSHLYENREATSTGSVHQVPLGVNALLDTVKVWAL
jgi:uncharacterized phiE125 gp8 family phage protein